MKFINDILLNSLNALDFPNCQIIIDIPKNTNHGDFSTNIALVLSKKINDNPVNIAKNITNYINNSHTKEPWTYRCIFPIIQK